ncbi:Uncharacterised protein [Sphingobacterium spiritivorum]|uniref:Lipoprotein n=1 Tax=Sphingobacterium spiritivorum TaxID=258 RepID=A0A380CR75_SPHSI|nr:hypothetical protein [Sphingobacterium spiritivorum]SUJ27041.1 Uncharacterised protein [Sphingobacterium spiritivorum]
MNVIKSLFGISVLALAVGCGDSANKSKDGTKSGEVALHQLADSTDAKKHFYFTIKEDGASDSSVFYVAKGLYNTDTVGLRLEVLSDIQPGINADGTPNEDNGFRKGAIKISSLGAQSDAFVKSAAHLFKIPESKPMLSSPILPTVFSSNKGKVDLTKNGTYSFKLFFDIPNDKQAEVFAVIDTYKKSFEITEKDSTFRTQFLKAFTGE